MNWVRIDVGICDDGSIGAVAVDLKKEVAHVVGLVVCVLAKLPRHARDGSLARVPPETLEQWAMWRGKRGAFNSAFRAHLCTDDGIVRGWEKHNGAAIRESDAARERMRNLRKKSGERSANETGTFALDVTRRDGTRRDEDSSQDVVQSLLQDSTDTRPKVTPSQATISAGASSSQRVSGALADAQPPVRRGPARISALGEAIQTVVNQVAARDS